MVCFFQEPKDSNKVRFLIPKVRGIRVKLFMHHTDLGTKTPMKKVIACFWEKEFPLKYKVPELS